jgi:CO/xanthine dehydrogenase Mo-binding subunit
VGEPKAAAMLLEAQGGLDEQGGIVAWDYQAWSPSHTNRPRQALGLLAGQELAGHPEQERRSSFFGGERNAPTNYDFENQRVTMHWIAQPPLHTSSMRSLGGAANTFANESFMDELAAAAEADPLAFRRRHLSDPRALAVLDAAAAASGWESGEPLPAGTGRGLAFARYENELAYVAMVAEVAVDNSTGAVQVRRLTVAHDCGLIVNPDGVRNQVEGNVLQGLSRALKEEVRFDSHGQTSVDWESYPILTFSEVAAAVANAICSATGARIRQVPFTPDRVLEALASR